MANPAIFMQERGHLFSLSPPFCFTLAFSIDCFPRHVSPHREKVEVTLSSGYRKLFLSIYLSICLSLHGVLQYGVEIVKVLVVVTERMQVAEEQEDSQCEKFNNVSNGTNRAELCIAIYPPLFSYPQHYKPYPSVRLLSLSLPFST